MREMLETTPSERPTSVHSFEMLPLLRATYAKETTHCFKNYVHFFFSVCA